MTPEAKAKRCEKRRLRQAIEAAAKDRLRQSGASCGNCAHLDHVPLVAPTVCMLDSDFHGYAIVGRSDICTRWKAKP